jgi:uncharacterized membrane protein YjgN (DUF898 family)
MSGKSEKRKKIILSKDETDILKWLFIKTLVPVGVIILVSSTVLFFGLQFLMKKASFGNYGVAPGSVALSVSQFISTYVFIAVINILLMLTLCGVVIYITLRNMVLPIMRITREVKRSIETKSVVTITVRKTDKLLVPLVDVINVLNKGTH